MIDQLLSQVSGSAIVCPHIAWASWTTWTFPSRSCVHVSLEPSPSSQFAKPFSDKELQNLRKRTISANTQKRISFAVNVWKEWSAYRRKMNRSDWRTSDNEQLGDSLELVSHYSDLLHFTTTGIPMWFITIFMSWISPNLYYDMQFMSWISRDLYYDMHIYELCMGFYSTSGAFDLYGCSGTNIIIT